VISVGNTPEDDGRLRERFRGTPRLPCRQRVSVFPYVDLPQYRFDPILGSRSSKECPIRSVVVVGLRPQVKSWVSSLHFRDICLRG